MNVKKSSIALGSAASLAGGATGALLLALAASPVSATGTTFTVDTLADGAATGSDCSTPVVGSCSLRDALGAVSTGDTIVFASGLTGTITLDSNEGELKFGTEISLLGPGADLLSVDATGASRVFYVCGGPTAQIAGITITGGYSSKGGALYEGCGSALTLRDVVVTGNVSTGGGGGVQTAGDLVVIGSEIRANTSSSDGGGLAVTGDLTMSGSIVSGNTSANDGAGGAYVVGDVSITSSTFDGNDAYGAGGALYLSTVNGTITIIDSTFSNNSSSTSYGGAIDIDLYGNTVLIANSTFTGNTAVTGGAVHIDQYNTVTFAQDTIVGNSATSTDALYSGGGLHFSATATTIDLTGTIVSGNTSVAGPADIGIGEGSATAGAITANDSLLGDVDARIAVTGANNIDSTTPGVGVLADNGGLTKTMALLTGSAAIDSGPATVFTFAGGFYDQRGIGFDRVVGARADIGAFEVQPPPPEPTTTTTEPSEPTTSTTTTASSEPVVPAFTG